MRRFLLATFILASTAAANTFTLEQVLSAPFPSELIAAPGGGKVAWLLNERGARNVWMAAAPDYKGVRLTSYTQDDGTDIGQLQWTPDGKSVVYVRGGDLEFLGRPDPNPVANPDGTEQAIWIVAPGEKPRKIADGHTPAISPKGDRVAFLRAGQLWWAPVISSDKGGGSDKAAPDKATMVFHPRSGVTAAEAEWSPDGSKLAFVSDRTTHSFIAVYDLTAKSLSYLDPTVDRDSNPVWSPDGKQIAFMRQPSGGGRGGRGGPGGYPGGSADAWSIRVATVDNGVGRQIWMADRGTGSAFHPMVADRQLSWSAGDRVVFPWEKDGWLHLYSVAVEGGAPVLLTPGNFEVEFVSHSADGKEIIYGSNQDDIDRRHIWRVGTASGPPRSVTSGEGLEWTPVLLSNAVAFIRADGKRPARAAIQMGGTGASSTIRDLAPDAVPADFPADSLVTPQQVIYTASDGMQIHGQLFLPPNSAPGQKHPALVFMHGGSRRQMLLGWHYMDYYNNAYGMNQYLASQGYVVLSINYRSGIGYGQAFREPANYGARGASEFNDVEGAGLYLKMRGDVDPAHVGLWGGSYGGYLTALGLARASNLFAAGVDFHGVHDWSVRGDGGGRGAAAPASGDPAVEPARAEAARLAYTSSPMASVNQWKSPVLLIHGDDDRNVNFSETVTLVGALRRQGVYFEQMIIPDEIHGFLRHASWLKAYHATADFFQRKL